MTFLHRLQRWWTGSPPPTPAPADSASTDLVSDITPIPPISPIAPPATPLEPPLAQAPLPADPEEALARLPRDIARDWLQTWAREPGVHVPPLLALAKAWMGPPRQAPAWRDALRRQRLLARALQKQGVRPADGSPAAAFTAELLMRAAALAPRLMEGRRWPALLRQWPGDVMRARRALDVGPVSWGRYPRLTVERELWRMHCGDCGQRCGIDNMLHCASCAAWVCFQCFPSHALLAPLSMGRGMNTRVLKCRCGAALRDMDDWLLALRLVDLPEPGAVNIGPAGPGHGS